MFPHLQVLAKKRYSDEKARRLRFEFVVELHTMATEADLHALSLKCEGFAGEV